ncbi:hypothetical protein K501DRAFT_189665, partial [Backusella circina FSU 941]
MNRELTITVWNANGLERNSISTVTNALGSSSLIFITETWLLSPLRLPTSWSQQHTYATPLVFTNRYGYRQVRGQNGLSLLINPEFPNPVNIVPSSSPYILSCQVSSLLIYCVYLPPSMLDSEAFALLRSLSINEYPSQLNTMICGDFNARYAALLGDSRDNSHGPLLDDWLRESGLRCWNAELAKGIPT